MLNAQHLISAPPGVLPVAGVAATNSWQYSVSSEILDPVLPTEAHRMLAAGARRFVRHALYLGTIVAVPGSVSLTESWDTVWLLIISTTLVHALRLARDTYLARELSADYQRHASRSARLVPSCLAGAPAGLHAS